MPGMNELTEITEAAGRFGLALSTLRFWERRGLLGSHRRSGRRCYDAAQLYRIALIHLWRETGLMSIRDIGALLNRPATDAEWRDRVAGQIDSVDAQVAKLNAAREYLVHLRECPHDGPPEECVGFRDLVGRAGY